MVKSSTKSTTAIEKLLEEKGQIEAWLTQLDHKGNKTPKHVLTKVRKDYQDRLDGVLGELQNYKDDISASLDQQRKEQERLTTTESEVAERLAEAELRHSVGEYDEREWSKLSDEINGELSSVRSDLESVEAEITKLEDIVGLIDKGPKAPAKAAPAAAGSRTADDEEIAELDEEIEDLPSRGSQTDAFDELAFLKSVTEDSKHGPSAKRASGVQSKVDLPSGSAVGAAGVEALPDRDGAPSKGKMKKSLKCGECGAQNLPTEWYCERCGAELAAL